MRFFSAGFALAVLMAAGSLTDVTAQALYGSIVGNVTDPQGAVLSGVSVTITNTATGLKLETATDLTGSYIFRNLLPGSYDMKLSITGFKEMNQSALIVTAGNPKRLDVTLEIGGAQDSVTVTADAATLRTEKSDLSTEINSKQVTQLPLNQYRNYQTLLNLVPGATPAQFQNTEAATPQRSLRTWVNGTQPNSNTTRVDGAVSVNVWLPHHAGYIQPAETIETVNIATNNFDADIGMAAGAAQTVVTKSGTNEFHGSAFEFMNFDKLNSNGFFNNAFSLERPPLSHHIYGGTIGGPIRKDKIFFFGSYEKLRDRRGGNYTYAVPTDNMRNGDFREVAAAYPELLSSGAVNPTRFSLYDPNTGAPGVRSQFDNFTIPTERISPIARAIMNYYPSVNSDKDLNSNFILDDYVQRREVQVDRANYDSKITWQRTKEHAIWGKFSMLHANVVDTFILGFDQGSVGKTKVYVIGAGHTWTLSPTLLLDSNFGYYRMNQNTNGPDYGQNIGIELGIPGVNDPNDIRASGMPLFDNGYSIGTTPSPSPNFWNELNYSFSAALTKVFSKHELRTGVDIVRMELNHRQAEIGNGLRGGFGFSGNITGATGYTARSWNSFAAFLLGQASAFGKDVQTEDMTGREWQTAFYVRDRWRVTDKLTLNLGLRLEYYPLMSRATRGIERLDYDTYTVLFGGLGDVPKDVGLEFPKLYAAPRVGVAYRIGEKSVVRAGYGQTINPLPWSRPMRGSFPYDINFNQSADQYFAITTLAEGIPPVPVPDISSGRALLPSGVSIRSPNSGVAIFPGAGSSLGRASIKQWNIAFEHKLPGDLITEIAYVGTRTDGGYADLNVNYGEPGGGNASRKYFGQAGTTAINDWAARTKARYHSLQVALNRPFKKGLMLKGAYTLSRAMDMTDEDGWVALTWNHPLMYAENYALAGFDRTHVFQIGFLYELPLLKNNRTRFGNLFGGWQINGIFAAYSGTPFSIGGTNNPLNCPSCGSILIDVSGDPKPIGEVGSSTATYYDKNLFTQPAGLGKEGFGNSGRNRFRNPPAWNLDFSLFKQFSVGERFKPEFRIEAANVFNHTTWGSPVTNFTANNFLQFTPGSAQGVRRVQFGLRLTF